MVKSNGELQNSSGVDDIHELGRHDPEPLHKPEVARAGDDAELSLRQGVEVGALYLQRAPLVRPIREHHREHHVQRLPVQCRGRVHPLRHNPYLYVYIYIYTHKLRWIG